MDDSAIMCDKIIAETVPTNFLLITIALWIAVSIYCYLIKYQAKQKHLLPFHDTKLKTCLY